MGVFQDLLDNAKTFKSTDPLARFIQSKINSQLDPALPAEAAAANEVQSWATSTQTSGNATLTFEFANGETFTTGNILFSAAATAIETAIDSAATGAIAGWTNGDISVAGGAVNVAPVTFTLDGASVASRSLKLITVTDVDGAGGAWGAVTRTTVGGPIRRALGCLVAFSVLDASSIGGGADDASNTSYGIGSEDRYNKFPQSILRDLAREAAEEDGNNNTYHSIIESLAIQDKARKAQRLGESSEVA